MKQISVIGREIPLNRTEVNYIDYGTKTSLSDTDILIFYPSYSYSCGLSNNDHYLKMQRYWKDEIGHFFNMGGVLFVVLSQMEGGDTNANSNYYPLPILLSQVKNAKGSSLSVSNPLFNHFYTTLKEIINYEVYVTSKIEPAFTTSKKERILGGHYYVNDGLVVLIPNIDFDKVSAMSKILLDYNNDIGIAELEIASLGLWDSHAYTLGQTFIEEIIKISKQLRSGSDKTPPPEWSQSSLFNLKEAEQTRTNIKNNLDNIRKLEQDNKSLHVKLEEQEVLKGLLYETGTPLEESVRKALRILGYQAEGYDNGELELDQVITSTEGHRFIGECEGRDTKPIAIVKLNQLLRAIQDDFARDDISLEQKAHGILIGNPFRLVNPTERVESPFTDKCLSTAKHSKVGLLTTVNLFHVARYIQESNDKEFAKKCREAICEQLGEVIIFPDIPSKEE